MTYWIAGEGRVLPLDIDHLPDWARRETYGGDWVLAEADDETGASAYAEAWDAAMGHLSAETDIYVAMYRAGAVGLPGDALVGVSEIADRADVKVGTVHAWRARHADFPGPEETLAAGPVWWWSDVARWLAVPRPSGRPTRSA